MDKISPEEKIQWMKKILQKKESISSVASKIGVYYTTVDKWLRNYKAIGPEAFFRKGHTYRTPAQKEAAVFDYLSAFSHDCSASCFLIMTIILHNPSSEYLCI